MYYDIVKIIVKDGRKEYGLKKKDIEDLKAPRWRLDREKDVEEKREIVKKKVEKAFADEKKKTKDLISDVPERSIKKKSEK